MNYLSILKVKVKVTVKVKAMYVLTESGRYSSNILNIFYKIIKRGLFFTA